MRRRLCRDEEGEWKEDGAEDGLGHFELHEPLLPSLWAVFPVCRAPPLRTASSATHGHFWFDSRDALVNCLAMS